MLETFDLYVLTLRNQHLGTHREKQSHKMQGLLPSRKSWNETMQLKKKNISSPLPFLFPVVFAGFHFSIQEFGKNVR